MSTSSVCEQPQILAQSMSAKRLTHQVNAPQQNGPFYISRTVPSMMIASNSRDSIQLASKSDCIDESPESPEDTQNILESDRSFNTRLLKKAEDII